jgi:hypothetical protein
MHRTRRSYSFQLQAIKTKTVNIIHFPYLDISQNVKIRDVPYSLKSPRNSECKLANIYGMNKGKEIIFFPIAGIR